MLKLAVILLVSLLIPQTQVLNINQVEAVRGVSVVIRSKQYRETEDGKREYGMSGCSGTYIASNQVLTAAHCFSRPTVQIWVRDIAGVSHEALIRKVDPEHDLALLWVLNVSNHKYAKLGPDVKVGDQVINVGSPLVFEFLVSEGIVADKDFKVKQGGYKAHYLVTTAMINPGSSGGGAFDSEGRLIGVNTMTIGGFLGWAGITMAVNGETIRRFLQ